MGKMVSWSLLLDPRMAALLFLVYCIGYLAMLDEEGAFYAGFLNFGPSKTARFMGITLDTWAKVGMVYALSFVTALMTGYYETVLSVSFHELLVDPELAVPFSRPTVFGLVAVDNVVSVLLQVITVLVISTQELQFMLPTLLADVGVSLWEAHVLLARKGIRR